MVVLDESETKAKRIARNHLKRKMKERGLKTRIVKTLLGQPASKIRIPGVISFANV